jgi:RND family efflux transporter MFP subunit
MSDVSVRTLSYFRGLLLLCVLLPVALAAEERLITVQPAYRQERLSGFTRERTRLVLSSEIAGQVLSMHGDQGDKTQAEQPVACLDPTFVDLELAGNRVERDSLRVDLDYFRKEVQRLRRLLEQNSSSQSQLDAAERNLAKTRLQIQSLEIAARTLEERKRRHCIHAPAGWRIIRRLVEPGAWIPVGQPVLEVGDYRSLRVPFALSPQEFRVLQEGDELWLDLPQQRSRVQATLLRVSPAFDEASRKIHVELELSEGVADRRGGLRVELPLSLPLNSGAVQVPATALVQRYEQYWLKRADGEEVSVVYLGRETGDERDYVRVASPRIKPGDRVLAVWE